MHGLTGASYRAEKLAVVGVLLEADECGCTPNPCLQLALDKAPVEPGAKVPLTPADVLSPALFLPAVRPGGADVAPSDNEELSASQKQAKLLLEGHRPYFHYTGSLTTPPCTEELDWFVMMDPVLISDHQVIIGNNEWRWLHREWRMPSNDKLVQRPGRFKSTNKVFLNLPLVLVITGHRVHALCRRRGHFGPELPSPAADGGADV